METTENTNESERNQKETPYFIHINKGKYAIATPKGLTKSPDTFDISFHDFALNADLVSALNSYAAAPHKPMYPMLTPAKSDAELVNLVAFFFSEFSLDAKEKEKNFNYMVNNGYLRIAIQDEQLKQKVNKILSDSLVGKVIA